MAKGCLTALIIIIVLAYLLLNFPIGFLLVIAIIWLLFLLIGEIGGRKQEEHHEFFAGRRDNHPIPSHSNPKQPRLCSCGLIASYHGFCNICYNKFREKEEEERNQPCKKCGRTGFNKLYNGTQCNYCDDADDD